MSLSFARQLAVLPLAAFLGVLAVGCGEPPSERTDPAPLPARPESDPAAKSPGGEPADGAQAGAPGQGGPSGDSRPITLRTVDETQFAQVLEQYRGKVILVDFWATWCPGCMKLFPHTVELSKRFSGQGLVVISMSLDDAGNEAGVRTFLESKGAALDNFLSVYGAGIRSFEAFRIEGALPYYKIYDRSGKLHKTFGGGEPIELEEVDGTIESLLAES